MLDSKDLHIIEKKDTIQQINEVITTHSPLLKGTRNRTDGLYDIPLYKQAIPRIKTNIDEYNYKMPPLHGLCPTNSLISSQEHRVQLHTNMSRTRTLLPRTHINTVMQTRLKYHIFMAQQKDGPNSPKYSKPALNVILRKQ